MTIPATFALLVAGLAARALRALVASVSDSTCLGAVALAAVATDTDGEDRSPRRIDAGPLTAPSVNRGMEQVFHADCEIEITETTLKPMRELPMTSASGRDDVVGSADV
jgi:hypothetical protein